MTTIHIDSLRPAWEAIPTPPPWMVVGVLPTVDQAAELGELATHSSNAFAYTVSDAKAEFWCPLASVENRGCGPSLITAIINVIKAGYDAELVDNGDDVIVPLGIPDEHGEWLRDADAVFWIGDPQHDPTGDRFACNMSLARWVIPIRWSSPLGWKDD